MEALIGLVGFALLIWLMFGGLQSLRGWLNLGAKKTAQYDADSSKEHK